MRELPYSPAIELHYYATEAPCDFNDPTEFLPSTEVVTQESRQFCQAFHGASGSSFFALCMSSRKNNIRMWAQYGGNHAGIMFTFNLCTGYFADLVGAGFLKRVIYGAHRHVINPDNVSHIDAVSLLTMKGDDWSHEDEWRLLLPVLVLPTIGGTNDLFAGRICTFIPLPDECISAITLGRRSSVQLYESVMRIKDMRKAEWQVRAAKLSDHKFEFIDEAVPFQ